jgi:CTP synthase
MKGWEELSKRRAKDYARKVRVGLVAKYVGNEDTYICVTEALKAAAALAKVGLEIVWINAEKAVSADFASVDGLLVPGGFGKRGIEGKVKAAEYALENDKPYLGLCLGLQVAVMAACRRGGIVEAGSEEFGATEKDGNNVVYIMEGQKGLESTGATMRLGDYPAVLVKGSVVSKIYGGSEVIERHRHRYEVNKKFLPEVEAGGLVVSGLSPDGALVEFVEAPGSRFFVATQAHPEFKARPMTGHPLFNAFMKSLK